MALPGLEDLVCAEVKHWFPHFETRIEHGGVTVMAALGEGLAMNMALKTPTRILLRVVRFRCRDFPKLFQKFSTFPWREILNPACELKVHASATRSRLKMKKRIEETCEKAWRAYQKKNAVRPDTSKKAEIFVRLNEDEATLSVDTSGERLHKRGARQLVGEAPLRETIAAALIQLLGANLKVDSPRRGVEIIDPMMGSGTFLLEAAGRDLLVEAREFAFEIFNEKVQRPPEPPHAWPAIESLVGFEMDPKTLLAARQNLAALKDKTVLHAEDFLLAQPLPEAGNSRSRWVLANPPYGERLKVKGPLDRFYADLFAAVERVAKPDGACFLLPANALSGRLSLPRTWKILAKRRFSNGGIPVVAMVFGRTGVL